METHSLDQAESPSLPNPESNSQEPIEALQSEAQNETASKDSPSSSIPRTHKQIKRNSLRTLAVDIGGSGIKIEVLDERGKALTQRARVPTPQPATPQAVISAILKIAKTPAGFDRVAVGFPGIVKDGVVFSAVNLSPKWVNCNLERILRQKLHRPVRVANDADVQGLGVIKGRGVELVITLGTGLGSALFVDGKLVPNLELAHHLYWKEKTYEQKLGRAALEKNGKKKWNKHLQRAIEQLRYIFNYDTMYIGGGNAKKISFKLPPNVRVVSNQAGLWGGIALWRKG